MEKSTKTTIFLIALGLATGAEAFVSQSPSTKVVDTKLNALWRNWIPQSTDFVDLMVGDENVSREFVVAQPLDENDVGAAIPHERTAASLVVSKTNAATAAPSSKNPRGAGFWAATATAAIVCASCSFVPSSFAVSGGGLDYAGIDISNQDFSNQNYKGKDFTQVLARNTNFAGSNLAGCRFPNAYLIGANYEGADIRGVSFEASNMENTNLKNAIASGAYFDKNIIEAANIENADFTDAQFPTKTLAVMCDRPDMKGKNPTTGVDTRDSAMCP